MPFIVGALFLVVGATLYAFPPKKRNLFYGYRTPLSMRSQQAWDFAQTFSGLRMLEIGGCLMLISFYTLFLNYRGDEDIVGFVLLCSAAAYLFIRTELALRNNFPSN